MDYIKWKTSTAWIQFKCETHLSVYNWRWWCKNVQIYSNESWETNSLTNSTNGVAATNIHSTTINTALAIPKNTGDVLPAMSDQKRIQMRLLLSELKLIIIDKISMVCNTTLLHIHQQLKETFDNWSELFAGTSIIALSDLYQLLPIQRKLVFDKYANDAFNLCRPWYAFGMIEPTEIMRQKMTNHLLNF